MSFEEDKKRGKILIIIGLLVFIGVYLRFNKNSLQSLLEIKGVSEISDTFSELLNFENLKFEVTNADDDEDGLDNALEALLLSSPAVADTDEDGFTDYQEFVSGYDPTTSSAIALTEEDIQLAFETFSQGFIYSGGDIKKHYYYERALGLFKAGDNELGFNYFKKALGISTEQKDFSNALQALYDAEKFEAALLVAQRYTGSFPDIAQPYIEYGYVKQKLGLEEGALIEYNIAKTKMGFEEGGGLTVIEAN